MRASMAHQGRGEKQALLKRTIQYKDDFRDLEVRADKKPLPARVAVQERFEVDDDTRVAFQVVYADLYLSQPCRPQAQKSYPYLPSQLSRVQSCLKGPGRVCVYASCLSTPSSLLTHGVRPLLHAQDDCHARWPNVCLEYCYCRVKQSACCAFITRANKR